MSAKFDLALRYIDAGDYNKAIQYLQDAVFDEEDKGSEERAIQYRCVLGELYANLAMEGEARDEFLEVLQYCRENNALPNQKEIALTFLDMFDGKISAKPTAKAAAERVFAAKPAQDKAFITKQMGKKHR